MCGFTVIKYKDAKKIDDNLKTKLLYSQSHRGPDYEKLIEKNNIFFFHNRLKIIDLSNNSNQPFVSKKTGNIIVFNGEIYNYKALKKYCGTRKFYSNSDTEILLYLYEKKGKEFIKLLNGIFSFVIYDKNKNLLISGRDRVGVKPLYTYEDKTKIIYSTEIKPILIIQKNKINFDEIKKYISSGKLHENKFTFFNNIFLLKPSCINIFNLKSFKSKTTSYWKLKKDNSLICKNYEEFYKKFIKLMKQSLNLNLVGDVKVGLLYSSGTDSNFLRSFLLKENKKNLKCFTFGWREKKYNEIERLKEIGIKTNKKGIKIINQSKIIKKLEKIIYMCEGPIGGFGIAGMYDLFKLIKKQKIKVVLSGEGSDEFLLGYYNFYIIFLRNLYFKNKNLFTKEFNIFKKNNKNIRTIKEFLKFSNKFLSDEIFTPDGEVMNDHDLINSSRKNKVKKYKNLDNIIDTYVTKTKIPKLLTFLDKCAGAHGVECRVPMLDHDLINFLYSNPDQYKIKNSVAKYPIKNWLKKNHVSYYEKKLFVSTPQREFLKNKLIKKQIVNNISNGNLVKNKIINFKKFKLKYDYYSRSKNPRNSFFIWKILNAEIFIKTFSKFNY